MLDELYKLAEGYNKRFPEGNSPYQISTRLAEECGEVAKEVNHWENSGIKRQKYGEPSKEKMAAEIKNVLSAVTQLAIYYNVEEELEKSIEKSLAAMKSEGLTD